MVQLNDFEALICGVHVFRTNFGILILGHPFFFLLVLILSLSLLCVLQDYESWRYWYPEV